MFSFDADANNIAGLAGINSELNDGGVLPQVGANQPSMPSVLDGAVFPTLVSGDYDNIVLPPEMPVNYGGMPVETALDTSMSTDLLTGSRVESAAGEANSQFATLTDALARGYEQLQQFASNPDLLTQMGVAFGNGFNAKVAQYLAGNWSNGIVNGPPIEVVSAAEIDGADGAFAGATNTIYISEELLAGNSENVGAVTNAWLEEYGHYVDTLVNLTDAPGDEGAIFAAVVGGEELSLAEVGTLKTENDQVTLTVDGRSTLVERSSSDWTTYVAEWDGNLLGEISLPKRDDGLNGINVDWGDGSVLEGKSDRFVVHTWHQAYFDANNTYKFRVQGDDGFQIFTSSDGQNWNSLTEGWEYAYRHNNGVNEYIFTPNTSENHYVWTILYENEGSAYLDLAWYPEQVSQISKSARKDDEQESPIRIQSIDGTEIADRPTSLVIHGNANSAGDMERLANAIQSNAPDQQVLTLDWSEAAAGTFNLRESASWIEDVAEAAQGMLKNIGLEGNDLNLIGHSLGAYVAYETAKQFSEKDNQDVASLIALDPASWTRGGYDENNVDFENYSNFSQAFWGSSFGHFDNSQTADQSFKIDYVGKEPDVDSKHGFVKDIFGVYQSRSDQLIPFYRSDEFDAEIIINEREEEERTVYYVAEINQI